MHNPSIPQNIARGVREFAHRARAAIVDPVVDDILVRIVPGLILLLGVLIAGKGLTLTTDLLAAFYCWLTLAITLLLAWMIGFALLEVSRWIGYAQPFQPQGWRRDLWEEGLNDFDGRVPRNERLTGGWLRILTEGTIATGAALFVILIVATLTQSTVWAWLVFALFLLAAGSFAVHFKFGFQWALVLSAVAVLLLLFALMRLESHWVWPIVLLMIGIALLRVVHDVSSKRWHQLVLHFVSESTVMVADNPKPVFLGEQEYANNDRTSSRSTYQDVYNSVVENAYYSVWGIGGQRMPVYRVTLASVLKGIFPWGQPYQFGAAAKRTVDSRSVLRPGPNGRGYRRLLHPNGVCLFGTWEITESSPYTGYFRQNKKALVIARYSTCCEETRKGRYRSLSLVGKLYPTDDPHEEVPTANFITQQDLGGERNEFINDAELRNTPDATVWRRGLSLDGLPVILLTGLLFKLVDREAADRQLYEIAQLNEEGRSRTPKFMRLVVDEDQPRIPGDDLDFRDEVLGQIYDPGNFQPQRKLVFHIEVSDTGFTVGPAFFQRRKIDRWKRIGRLVFDEAVASYNGDFVLHFHHPGWRDDPENPMTAVRPPRDGNFD